MATESDTNPNDFFVAGGTLRASAPSYVLRPADDELFEMAAQGAFCYVLTPRQMGKSSLMIRTAKRLGEQGVRAGIVDLTQIGAKVTVEQWYLGLLSQLRRSLRLETDYAEWWAAHNALGEVQRFTDFLREVVLAEIKGRVVIFIDEIDSTLQLDFRDDFFAAIRAMYNARAESPDFGRLSFVLLGVASPPDLIKDLTRTPFNIGQAIALKEFSRADAAVLQDELEKQFAGKGSAIFERIFYWTNGHPYLTQKLCLTIAEKPEANWGDAEVDALVGQMFLTEEARKESNLQYVQNNILSHELKLPMLKLYRNVVRGGAVAENQSREQNQLKLSGLVKTEGGALVVRNRVYGQVFDADWVRANIPVNWTRRLAVTASALLAIFIGLVAYFFVESSIVMPGRVRDATNNFFKKAASKDRIAAVATIVSSKGTFDVKDNNDSTIELFYALSWEDQLRLFDPYETREVSDKDLVTVIKALYVTLADVDGTRSNLRLLEKMYRSLDRRESSDEAKKLKNEIRAWLDGAMAEERGDIALAERAYVTAINLNASNPATRFSRGKFFAKVNRPTYALSEFNEVILIAQRLAATTKSVEAIATTNQPQTTARDLTATATQLPQLTKVSSTNITPNTLPTIALPTDVFTTTIAQTPIPAQVRFMSRFATSGQMIVAVRDFILSNVELQSQMRRGGDFKELSSLFPLKLLPQLSLLRPNGGIGTPTALLGNNFEPNEQLEVFVLTAPESPVAQYLLWFQGKTNDAGQFTHTFTVDLPANAPSIFYLSARGKHGFVAPVGPVSLTNLTTTKALSMTQLSTQVPSFLISATLLAPQSTIPPGLINVDPVGEFYVEYHNNRDLLGAPVIARNEPLPGVNWGAGAPAGLNADNFSVSYYGRFSFPEIENYEFVVVADDGVRLFVDDALIINEWRIGPRREIKADLPLLRGEHRVRLEYFDSSGSAQVSLRWMVNYSRWEGRYYNSTDWMGAVVLKRNDGDADGGLRMDWGDQSPGPNLNPDNFSANWERRFLFGVSGDYKFTLELDDGAKVYIDGVEVFNNLNGPGVHEFTRKLARGYHAIQVLYVEYAGGAKIKFDWTLVLPTPIPAP